jgi:hypothetical protein
VSDEDAREVLKRLIDEQNANAREIAKRMIEEQIASGRIIRLPGGHVIERDKATPEQLAAAIKVTREEPKP